MRKAKNDYYRAEHERDFKKWRLELDRKSKTYIYDTPEQAGIKTDLKVGSMVQYKNGYGIAMGVHKVLGFCTPNGAGGCVFLDIDCYWFPVKLWQLTPVK